MKNIALLLFLLLSAHMIYAQEGRVPKPETIKLHKIKTITAKISTGPDRELLRDKWTYDKEGNLLTHQLFDEVDTVLHIERYFYKNQLLDEKHLVAHMNFNSNKPDSVITKYHYDAQNNLVGENAVGYNINRNTQIEFSQVKAVRKIYFDKGTQQKYDSLTYNPNNKLFQVYHSKSASVSTYTYTQAGQTETQQEHAINDTTMIFNFSKFYYNKNLLVKEIEGFSWNGKKENLTDEEYQYIYDEKQLLKEIKHIRNNVVINTEKYYYTFW
jgi:hypothetical protein